MTRLKLLMLLAAALAGCHDNQPDFTPIRDGLRAVGICLVAAATVTALAAVINGGKGGKDD